MKLYATYKAATLYKNRAALSDGTEICFIGLSYYAPDKLHYLIDNAEEHVGELPGYLDIQL